MQKELDDKNSFRIVTSTNHEEHQAKHTFQVDSHLKSEVSEYFHRNQLKDKKRQSRSQDGSTAMSKLMKDESQSKNDNSIRHVDNQYGFAGNIEENPLQKPFSTQLATQSVPCSVSSLLSDILNMRNPTIRTPFPALSNFGSKTNMPEINKSEGIEKNNADLILNAVLNQPWMQSNRVMFSNTLSSALSKISWRKGKWIDEEELYTRKLIEAFNSGYLKIPTGTTLRSFLSEKLSW